MSGAVEAVIARNERPVVCFMGDGSDCMEFTRPGPRRRAQQCRLRDSEVLRSLELPWRSKREYDFRLYRVGNEALLVRRVMEAALIGRRRQLASTVIDFRT